MIPLHNEANHRHWSTGEYESVIGIEEDHTFVAWRMWLFIIKRGILGLLDGKEVEVGARRLCVEVGRAIIGMVCKIVSFDCPADTALALWRFESWDSFRWPSRISPSLVEEDE